MTDRRIPRPGLSREQADELVARVEALGQRDPRREPDHREPTKVGIAPPRPGSAPMPPPPADVAPQSATLESPPPPVVHRVEPAERRQPRSMSPAPWDPRASSPELAQAVRDMGDQLKQAPTSTPMPLPPKRSLSPAPWSSSGEGLTGEGVRVKWSTLKKAAPWVLAALGLTGGGGTGYFVGLRQARAEIAELQAAAEDHEQRIAKRETAARSLSKTVDAIDDSLKAEAQERRADVGALRTEVKKLNEGTARIEGIVPK